MRDGPQACFIQLLIKLEASPTFCSRCFRRNIFSKLGKEMRLLRSLVDIRSMLVIAVFSSTLLGGRLSPAIQAEEYTPDSPAVRMMIDRGVGYIERRFSSGQGLPYELLMGYTVYKATENADSPLVKIAINHAKRVAAETDGALSELDEYRYVVSVAIQLLSSVDPIGNAPQLTKMLDYLVRKQRASGAYNYDSQTYATQGDTSQTQYVLLGLWSLDHANVDVPPELVRKAFDWLKSTQFSDGSWTYQNPGTIRRPDHVMTAVGASAIMIAADMLGALRGGGGSGMKALESSEADQDLGVPQAFRRVIEVKDGDKGAGVTPATVASIAQRSNSWLQTNKYVREPGLTWHYYYLYSLERYQAFLEALNGRREKSPKWYNEIVESLQKTQNDEGAWGRNDPAGGSAESSTCFAILFLLRTTQKSIGDLNEAVAIGGYGLGADMTSVDVSSGKVEDKKEVSSIDEALSLLEADTKGKDASKDLASRIRLAADPKEREQQLDRFARLLRSDNAISRRVAAKVLCRGDNLDMVPHLIYALSDPDEATCRSAENSLRVLSRQLNTYKIPVETAVNANDQKKAQEYWKEWYRSVRPDYIFLQSN